MMECVEEVNRSRPSVWRNGIANDLRSVHSKLCTTINSFKLDTSEMIRQEPFGFGRKKKKLKKQARSGDTSLMICLERST